MCKLLVSLLCAALWGTASFAAGIAPKYASSPGLKEYPSSDVLVLSESREYTVEPDGRVTERYFKAEKILTYQGMDLVGDPLVPFNSETQEIRDYALTTYTPDGRVVGAKANSFNEMTPFELEKAPAYTSWREMVMTKVGLDLGAVVESRYVISDKRPWRKFFEKAVPFVYALPCLERIVKVTVPNDVALHWAFLNGDVKPAITSEGGATTYAWAVKSADGVDMAEGNRDEWLARSRLVFTTCPGWREANAAVGELTDGAVASGSEEINKKTRELVAGAATIFNKVQCIHDYVAEDIPTVEWPLGLFGFTPRPAAEVFHTGYGHALDKAVLLCAMLKQIGVEAAPAACALGIPGLGDVDAVPCLAQLDEILVHADVDGKPLWLDPCAKLSERSQRDFQDYKGLPLTVGYDKLHTMPAAGKANRLEANLRATVTKALAFAGEGTFVFSGGYTTFYEAQGSQDALKTAAEEWLGAVLPGADVVSTSVNLMAPEQVSVTVAFKGEAKEAGKGIHVLKTGLLHGSLLAHPAQIFRQKRELPLLLPFAGHEETRVSFELPAGLKPAYVPGRLSLKETAGSVNEAWSLDGNQLTMTTEADVPSRFVKPEDYPGFRRLCSSFAAPSANTILFTK